MWLNRSRLDDKRSIERRMDRIIMWSKNSWLCAITGYILRFAVRRLKRLRIYLNSSEGSSMNSIKCLRFSRSCSRWSAWISRIYLRSLTFRLVKHRIPVIFSWCANAWNKKKRWCYNRRIHLRVIRLVLKICNLERICASRREGIRCKCIRIICSEVVVALLTVQVVAVIIIIITTIQVLVRFLERFKSHFETWMRASSTTKKTRD